MTETDVRAFLERFSAEDLAAKGILNGKTSLLNHKSVAPLTDLMNEHSLSRLVSAAREWSFDVNGEFRNPHSDEAKSGNVQDLKNPGNVFNYQNTSINPHYARGQEPEAESADELTFTFERDLQKALRKNIGQLDLALTIVDGGSEQTVDAGRIDITAKASDGALVVIELKTGKADLRAIGQILSYMGTVNSDTDRDVRGILVAGGFDPRVVMAARAVPNLSLKEYSFQFAFSDP